MTRKGLIFSAKAENGDVVYQAAPFVIGIYEFQVNRLTDGFLKDLGEYWGTARAGVSCAHADTWTYSLNLA